MFTGLIQHIGRLTSLEETKQGHHMTIDSCGWAHAPQEGASIAVDGCCLTLARAIDRSGHLRFDLTGHTASHTIFAEKAPGTSVNLEAALRAGDPLGGHLVQGHVDGVGRVAGISDDPARHAVSIELDEQWSELCRSALVPGGSITVDGVSLTITSTDTAGFEVVLIPVTRDTTTLGNLQVGQGVNVEVDSIAKTVAQTVRNLDSP